MKNYFLLFLLTTMTLGACNNSGTNDDVTTEVITNTASADNPVPDPSTLPILVFDTLTHDFGDVPEGQKAEFEFKFKNTGRANLLITNVSASCGCTTPYYPKNIIKVGDAESIKVIFDSEGRPGKFNKTITVTANTYPNTTQLHISGNVTPIK